MEPLPEGSGRLPFPERHHWPPRCFNGAASRRKRKGFPLWESVWCHRCFNGAASRRKRKGRATLPHLSWACHASMEPLPEGSGRPSPGRCPPTASYASMEPLPEGSGRVLLVIACQLRPPSFNGAASRRKRKGNHSDRELIFHLASMEPLPEGSGRPPDQTPSKALRASFNGAASRRKRKGPGEFSNLPTGPAASMEPLPEGSGRQPDVDGNGDPSPASMEPLPEGSGRT